VHSRSFICEQCGAEFHRPARRPRPGKRWRFCATACWYKYNSGIRCHLYKGGVSWQGSHGYRDVATSDPRYRKNRKCREHTAIVERIIGRNLPIGAEIHHVNEDRSDNRPENLVVCQDRAYHMLLHARAERLKLFGTLTRKRCIGCERVCDLADFYRDRTRSVDGRSNVCKSCCDEKREVRRNKHESICSQAETMGSQCPVE